MAVTRRIKAHGGLISFNSGDNRVPLGGDAVAVPGIENLGSQPGDQPGQDRDDRDHDQQFNERERPLVFLARG